VALAAEPRLTSDGLPPRKALAHPLETRRCDRLGPQPDQGFRIGHVAIDATQDVLHPIEFARQADDGQHLAAVEPRPEHRERACGGMHLQLVPIDAEQFAERQDVDDLQVVGGRGRDACREFPLGLDAEEGRPGPLERDRGDHEDAEQNEQRDAARHRPPDARDAS
jgi:hypothetical protein